LDFINIALQGSMRQEQATFNLSNKENLSRGASENLFVRIPSLVYTFSPFRIKCIQSPFTKSRGGDWDEKDKTFCICNIAIVNDSNLGGARDRAGEASASGWDAEGGLQ
jgi:hypothetical protein